MERAVLTPELMREILIQGEQIRRAKIFEGNTNSPQNIQKIVIDLSTARLETNPYKISFPFRSVYVESASDVLANIFVKPNTQDSVQSFFKLKANDSWASDDPISTAFLHWDAQPGKSLTLVFFTNSEFRSGSQISVTGGGVSIVDGSTFTQASQALVAATAAIVFAQDSTRKVGTIQNKTGASIWVGASGVNNTTSFFEVSANDVFIWRNTAALYAYSIAGGNIHKCEEY